MGLTSSLYLLLSAQLSIVVEDNGQNKREEHAWRKVLGVQRRGGGGLAIKDRLAREGRITDFYDKVQRGMEG